jgi:hypothetical protein
MPVRCRSVTALAVGIITASAARSTVAQPKPTRPDACSLLTKEDAAEAFGGDAVKGPKVVPEVAAGDGGSISGCGYTGAGFHSMQLNLTRLSATNASMYRSTCDKQNQDGLAGLGDLACWYNAKHEELHAFKGLALVSIELRGLAAPSEPIKAVMRKALGRLK